MNDILNKLIHPTSKLDFMDCYEDNRPFVAHDITDLDAIFNLPFLKSFNELISFWPKDVEVYPKHLADEEGALKTSPQEAKKIFNSEGRGLLFNDANLISEVLQGHLNQLRKDLGLPSMTFSRNLIYATKEGRGTDTHFDQNINFVIQIHGEKKWWVAPNKHIENPQVRHTLGQELNPELELYTELPLPTEMPAEATEFLLKPGSMLFVPRGSWHKTEALTDALSLNFTFSAPTWVDIFTMALKGRLTQSSVWRRTANFMSDPKRFDEAADEFNMLLESLNDEIPHWKAEDILEAMEAE